MSKTNLLGYSLPQLEKLMISLGEKGYKGRQLFKWLYSTRLYDFALMTDLTKPLRSQLAEQYEFRLGKLSHEALSEDGTRKFLFELDDGSLIESVLIPDDPRRTACISSQVGCALGCRFCATGMLGFKRDLTAGEILSQLIYLRDRFGGGAFTNVVFMGMGEPLLNLAEVVRAVDIMRDSVGLGIAAKKITVSTVGIVPGIRAIADSGLKVRLAVSLNAADQKKREQLMPAAKKHKLNQLTDALKCYTTTTGFRVTFEYIVFKGFNHGPEDVKALARMVQGIPCKINLLAYNRVEGLRFERPSDEEIDTFARELYPRVPAVTVRKSRGVDICAACGQLAAKRIDGRA